MNTMSYPFLRPEDRHRSEREMLPRMDALPACLRSEAFAEDLSEPAPSPRPPRGAGRVSAVLGSVLGGGTLRWAG